MRYKTQRLGTARNNKRGFTLVELSIVLVIIGLIIGGALTGQQIIQSARITNAVNAIQAYQAQVQTYMQNYGALPGDDKSASTRFGQTNGDGDGAIGTASSFDTVNTTGAPGESRLVWAHLRAAGLVKNQQAGSSTAIQPANPFGGVFGIQASAFKTTLGTTVVCLNNVPGSAAQAIDTKLDDGFSNAGIVRAALGSGAGHGDDDAADDYSGDSYTLCAKM